MKYFFLLSWLPELTRDQTKLAVTLPDLAAERFHVDSEDWSEIERVLIRGDIFILEKLLEEKSPTVEFSLYDASFWQEELKTVADAPPWLAEILETFEPGAPAVPKIEALYEAYYRHVLTSSKNEFLRNFVRLDMEMRNFQAGRRARMLGRPPATAVIGESEAAEAAAASSAEDFGLAREHPWVEKLLPLRGPLEIEEGREGIMWDFLEEKPGSDPFAFESLLTYIFKLHILERRLSRSKERGLAMIRVWEGR